MKRFGLIGYPLGHSFSPKFFAEKFEREGITNCRYDLFPIDTIEKFPGLLEQYSNLEGLTVTIPYKEQVLNYLDTLDETARAIGAVNTIDIEQDGLTGYNTDVIGFTKSLQPLLQPHHDKALILGTGGAAKAVSYGLKRLNISYHLVSRSPEKGDYIYADMEDAIIQQHSLIINTTPLGMHPEKKECPDLAYHALTRQHLLYDLVYNPETTLFMKKGQEQGAAVKNGLEMLHLQAEAAWAIWNR